MRELHLITLSVALLLVCLASAARADFVNGVETFDGTVKDNTTWQEYVPAGYTPVVQNSTITFPANSTMSNTGDYTSIATVVAGQAVSADVTLINPNPDPNGPTQS